MTADEVGCSPSTVTKHAHFAQIIRMHLRIVKGIFARFDSAYGHYLYVDLNAGPGRYWLNDELMTGSPLLFSDAAVDEVVRYRAWFCEKNERTADQLSAHVLMSGRVLGGEVAIERGDHVERAPMIAEELRAIEGKAFGLIFADPNGTALPVNTIRLLANAPRESRLDVLAYVSATNQKRVLGAHGGPRLLDDLRQIGRRFLFLRIPERQHQWTFAILTNWPSFPELRAMGFRQVGTPEGDELADRLNLTTEEFRAKRGPFQLTGPMRNIFGTRGSSPSGPRSSGARAGVANGAASVRQLSLITCDTPDGAPSMFQPTSSPSATDAIANSTGRTIDD